MAKKDKIWYLKQCRKCLMQIQQLRPEDGIAFLRLKKKAQKYLNKAKEIEAAGG